MTHKRFHLLPLFLALSGCVGQGIFGDGDTVELDLPDEFPSLHSVPERPAPEDMQAVNFDREFSDESNKAHMQLNQELRDVYGLPKADNASPALAGTIQSYSKSVPAGAHKRLLIGSGRNVKKYYASARTPTAADFTIDQARPEDHSDSLFFINPHLVMDTADVATLKQLASSPLRESFDEVIVEHVRAGIIGIVYPDTDAKGMIAKASAKLKPGIYAQQARQMIAAWSELIKPGGQLLYTSYRYTDQDEMLDEFSKAIAYANGDEVDANLSLAEKQVYVLSYYRDLLNQPGSKLDNLQVEIARTEGYQHYDSNLQAKVWYFLEIKGNKKVVA